MKRTPLKRRKPLARKRTAPVGKSKYRRRPRDVAYMMWVKRQPCCVSGISTTPCGGPVEADHAGRRGVGQKADDRTCIPLCRNHHRERTDFSGTFRNHDRESMRSWLAIMVETHRREYELFTQRRTP